MDIVVGRSKRRGSGGKRLRFSDHFKLGKSQAELDFVDIPLNTDIRLFVDPYALSIEDDPWFVDCNNLVIDYFQLLINSIRKGEHNLAFRLLSNLHESNETRLGYSRKRPSGRGVGKIQAGQLHRRLKQSKAVISGKLRDLSDCELLIPGISSDKISDITINIIREKLVEYTEDQCAVFGIDTHKVPSGLYWDAEKQHWRNRYARLPLYQGYGVILVPKAAVRFRLEFDHHKYYRYFVLQYLQAEHLEAGSSLVTVLQNGKRKVFKKDLEEKYPLNKEFLSEFSEKHPDVLEKYKKSLPQLPSALLDEEIEQSQAEPRELDQRKLVDELDQIPVGHKGAASYHDFIIGALETIFYPNLRNPIKEEHLDEGRKRVDIVFNNGGDRGFFFDLATLHRIKCPYVFFECKNYSDDPENPEFDQLTGRFGDDRGRFGVLVCRRIIDKSKALQRCRDVVHARRGYMLAIDDVDLKALIELRANHDFKGIADHMDDLFRRLVM